MKLKLSNDMTFFGKGNQVIRNKMNKDGTVAEHVIIDTDVEDIKGQEHKFESTEIVPDPPKEEKVFAKSADQYVIMEIGKKAVAKALKEPLKLPQPVKDAIVQEYLQGKAKKTESELNKAREAGHAEEKPGIANAKIDNPGDAARVASSEAKGNVAAANAAGSAESKQEEKDAEAAGNADGAKPNADAKPNAAPAAKEGRSV